MRYEVLITEKAELDMESIHDYIAESDSPSSAHRVLDALLKAVDKLETFPERGSRPRELLALGYGEYRQIVFRLWRVIYQIKGRRVYIHLIADGRRDMQSLLAQRLLGA